MRTSIRRLATLSPLFLLLVIPPGNAEAAVFDVFASKDTHVWSLFPDNNFGNFTRNEIGREIGKGETGSVKRALLHFDLSGLPAGVVITNSFIHMFIPEGVGEDLPITVWRLTEGFAEGDGTSGVTWNTQPDVIPSPTYSRTANGHLETFLNFAPMVIAARESSDPDNLWLRISPTDEITNETHWFGFQTRDDPNSGTNGAAPWLIIYYEIPTPTPTPTATPTVTPTPTTIINPDETGPTPDITGPTPDMSVPSTCADAEFLYMGPNPIQIGMQPNTIDFDRAAVLRGHVRDAAGVDLFGVRVEILGKPMYGYTLTRANGAFDLAVNGGGMHVVKYSKSGFIPVQRQIDVAWKECALLPDVVMLERPLSGTAIPLGPSAPFAFIDTAVSNDADGARTACLMFQQGTEAQRYENGVPDPGTLPSIHVKAVEFTVGSDGPDAMPGDLPPTSGYTYAIEFDADEITDPDTTHIEFSKPVSFYLENFLEFEVGEQVPTGYYNRILGTWVPSEDGRVIRLLGENGGFAEVDIDNDLQAEDLATLQGLGFTTDELAALVSRYQPASNPNQELWRVPVHHFSPWDCNWNFGPPSDAIYPDQPAPTSPELPDDPCERSGSVIGCKVKRSASP
jgi:hypothetical protein